MRKIKTFSEKDVSVSIYWNAEYEEFCCKLFDCGVHIKNADYFTDDKDDAMPTAQLMLEQYVALN